MLNKLEYGKEMLENLKINEELMKLKGIDTESEYYEIQSLYKKAFEMFLNQKLELDKNDDFILKSNLDFGIVDISKRSCYHRFSYLNLNYIYIRNFLFIERLSIADIAILKGYVKKQFFDIDQTLLDLVERTFRDVCFVDTKAQMVNYGVESPLNHFSTDAIALYIIYGKNSQSLNKADYIKNMQKKEQFLNEIIEKIKKKGLENGIKVEVSTFKSF